MGTLVLPVIQVIIGYLLARKTEVARATGLAEDGVAKVGEALQNFMTQDTAAQQKIYDEMDKARQADVATLPGAPPVVLLLRGLVRPVITLVAFGWYVAARANGVTLGSEDYAIIGGVVAFWFGFRPFEKGFRQPKP
ncbi:MAG TPA: hypothetical protein VHP58_00580 [Alphaproteobacteria bacterium]|nr:hypothetical protein [Alphaproteobacteria bacterium]